MIIGIGLLLHSSLQYYHNEYDSNTLSGLAFGVGFLFATPIMKKTEKLVIELSKNRAEKGVVVWAEANNCSIFILSKIRLCWELFKLGLHYKIEILEVNDLDELNQKISKISESSKIKSLIISAHGNPHYMRFNNENVYGDEPQMSEICKKLDDKATINLISCSAGKEIEESYVPTSIFHLFNFTGRANPDMKCVAQHIATKADGKLVYAARENLNEAMGWSVHVKNTESGSNISIDFENISSKKNIGVVYSGTY